MTITKDVLGLSLGLQAVGLAVSNIPKFNKKGFVKKQPNLLKQGVKNIIGTSLISAQSGIIGGIE